MRRSAIGDFVGYPAIIRPSFTLGGSGGGVAYNREEYETIVRRGLAESPTSQVLIERSLLGWKEFELEVMRDHADNVVIVCSIENIDPMGVHTGDSITVAPAMTLTDREYQVMRDAAVAVIREIGVEAGGCNIQFAINPNDGEMVVIEMNPRVSRSSALASKATGFPIARIGAKLAVGYRLDEIPNDITKTTPASFEPVLDYVVVKCPRFAFEKFAGANPYLTTQMKSVGESMAIGRTFKEAFQKGLRALEIGRSGWEVGVRPADDRLPDDTIAALRGALRQPTPERIFQIKRALEAGMSIDDIYDLTKIDRWFLYQMQELLDAERRYATLTDVSAHEIRTMKRAGFSDRQLGVLRGEREEDVRARRWSLGIHPSYKMVDTCAGEFPSETPYLYSSYDEESESPKTGRRSVVILGSGPNRIGQGVEFDYCCVRAVMALRDQGYETIMINSNPETVSTDYDISDKLFFEPLTLEDVLEIVRREEPEGVIVQLGGQTPLKLTRPLEAAGVKILGTSPDAIDVAEDRQRFEQIARELNIRQPENGTATSVDEAVDGRDADRVSGARSAVVRARRTRDADRVRRGLATRVLRDGGPRLRRPTRADRLVPRGCVRGGRRRRVGREARGDRRRDAAHRGCRDSLRRLGVRAPAVPHHRCRHRHHAPSHDRACEGARCGRADQRAVRGQERHRVCARGQPARQPHDPVRVEGDRRPARVGRGARHDGRDVSTTSGSPRRSCPIT